MTETYNASISTHSQFTAPIVSQLPGSKMKGKHGVGGSITFTNEFGRGYPLADLLFVSQLRVGHEGTVQAWAEIVES